jgi:hypothetical protein
MSFSWSVTPTQAWGGMATAYAQAIRRGVRAIADRYAPEIEAWMKANGSWVDRTGNLRQTLHTEVEELGLDMVSVILSHGMSYGVYIEGFTPEGRETMQGGRYAIISPAIDVFSVRIWADVQAMLR